MTVIVADESVDVPIILAIRNAGWVVWSVSEECPSVDDDIVLATAHQKKGILITMDSDFGELVFDQDQPPPFAVIFVRNKGLPLDYAIALVLDTLLRTDIAGQYITLTRTAKRRRKLPDRIPT